MKTFPYLVNLDSTGELLKPIEPGTAHYRERWLQDLLRLHPDILPVKEIEPVFHPLVPIGYEVPVAAGYIDNLFITPQGYPIIVETKLWRNPEAKRDVLAQLIDYASSLSNWTFENLDQVTRKYTRDYEGSEKGMFEWVGSQFDVDVDSQYFEETVSQNLRLGRMLVVVVGDRIRSSVVEMLNHINKFPHLAMNVSLIELRCFKLKSDSDWPVLVVPSILAKAEIVERTIVQVNVSMDGKVKVEANQGELIEKQKKIQTSLTEDSFWELLKNQDAESLEPAQELINYYRKNESIKIRSLQSSIAVHLYLPETNQKISLFFIKTDGVLECWPAKIAEQLTNGGLDSRLEDEYINELATILKHKTKILALNYPVKKVQIEALKATVDRFIDKLIRAEPKLDVED